MKLRYLLPLLGSLWGLSSPALAQDLAVFGLGATDVIRNQKSAVDVRLEYRSGLSLLPFTEPYLAIRPWAGIETTSRGSIWGGGGILLDIGIGRFALVPQAGIGAYGEGNGKKLGSPLEFRTGVEVAYKFADQSRVALGFSHTSNAGVSRHNPGTEAITLNYQLPLGSLFGR